MGITHRGAVPLTFSVFRPNQHHYCNMPGIRMWLWIVPDEITGKCRKTTYRMTEEQARERFGETAKLCPHLAWLHVHLFIESIDTQFRNERSFQTTKK
jgi:hypothetical protein